jgi:hypothetical protein
VTTLNVSGSPSPSVATRVPVKLVSSSSVAVPSWAEGGWLTRPAPKATTLTA